MLLPPIKDSLFEKYGYKGDSIVASRPGCGKIVFILLYEVVAIYVQFTLLYIWDSGFKSPLWEVFWDSLILAMNKGTCFQYYLEDLLKVILGILRNLRESQTMPKVQKTCWFNGGSWGNKKIWHFFISALGTWSRRDGRDHRGLVFTRASIFFQCKYDNGCVKT